MSYTDSQKERKRRKGLKPTPKAVERLGSGVEAACVCVCLMGFDARIDNQRHELG